jgi:hypothetical protein
MALQRCWKKLSYRLLHLPARETGAGHSLEFVSSRRLETSASEEVSTYVPVDGVTGGATPSFRPPSCSFLGSSESFRPRPLPRFLTRLNNEGIASTSIFGGNNGCICNSSDGGVKSMPSFC